MKYLTDSVFAFTDLPIRILTVMGLIGVVLSAGLGLVVLAGKALDLIEAPGYAATILAVMFFGALNVAGLGIVGGYVWRSYENTKRRPLAVISRSEIFTPAPIESIE